MALNLVEHGENGTFAASPFGQVAAPRTFVVREAPRTHSVGVGRKADGTGFERA